MIKIFTKFAIMKLKFITIFILSTCCLSLTAQENSVLSSGKWFKLGVEEDGIYRLNYSDLEQMGFDLSNTATNSIKMFGGVDGMLPNLNSIYRSNDLEENAIFLNDQNNNQIFDVDDYILFYGKSPNKWKYNNSLNLFEYEKHFFSDENYYFITIDETSSGKRISMQSAVNNPDFVINYFNDHVVYERDLENLIKSGNKWFGERFEIQNSYSFDFNFPNLLFSEPIRLKTNVVARSINSSSFSLNVNSNFLTTIPVSNIVYQYATDFAKSSSKSSSFFSSADNVNINISFNSSENNAIGWLDYFEINAKRSLKLEGDFMSFRNTDSLNSLKTAKYEIISSSTNLMIWDITNLNNIHLEEINYNNSILSFADSINSLKEYCVLNGNNFPKPKLIGSIDNQNLHAISSNIEYIIISHPNFVSASSRLADFHSEIDNLNSLVVTTEQIYNEFSSGVQDVSAIRDFIKMLYDRNNSSLEYVLLMGDGSYDHKSRILPDHNFIPTYQSNNSLSPVSSYLTDDYFVLLDESDGDLSNDLVDISIGRIPVVTNSQANEIINKIEKYYGSESLGDWRNNITFIADDGDNGTPPDGNLHMSDADKLAEILDTSYANLNIKKIYLDNYLQESTPGGPRSPAAQEAINQSVSNGSFLMNYTGHGGPLGWTQERILEIDQINNWSNIDKLPLFMTATCKFANFDDPDKTSAGEQLLLNPNGGAIALLTTTRLVYSFPNYTLNKNFINVFYEKVNGNFPTLGQLFKKTKVLSGSNVNSRNFTLLGDPALKLSYPKYVVSSTSNIDTLKALQEVIISGEVKDENGMLMNGFNGEVFPIVYDKEIISLTLGQESCTPMPYRNQNNIIYKGKATVSSGQFTFSFVVPKDIENNFAKGKISYYASDENGEDASGYDDSFVIGGLAENVDYDFDGPEISLFLNNRNFLSGGITNSNPILIADIEDYSGVNTVGNGIGHDIVAYLDDNTSNPIILNNFYSSQIDNYKKGSVVFPFNNLNEGEHKLTLKVWDVFNNSSEKEIFFNVVDSEVFIISDFNCFPNPLTTSTDFYFEYNQSENISSYTIDIYSITGQLIKTIFSSVNDNGYRVGPINWNTSDSFSDKITAGIYIVKLGLDLNDGGYISKSIRIAITN
tara:strand:+ start:87 stop:3485 length:3399 start_codon:yes stop_codon:yes gene_type:complete